MQKTRQVPLVLFLAERIVNQIVKLGVLAYILAWLLSHSSRCVWVNLPFAVILVFLLRWLSLRLVVRVSEPEKPQKYKYYEKFSSCSPNEICNGQDRLRSRIPDRDVWKRLVNAPIVESAWESFCGSIIQEWIYDAWYSLLTPDREFPSEIRRMMNDCFAEVAYRARRIDLKAILISDMCDLFIEQLELYRTTKKNVGILNEGDLRPSSRDRAFQQEMKTERKLHLAFRTRDGHYKVIKRIAEGVVCLVMNKEDFSCGQHVKVLTREMVATCLIRPIIMLFTPYNANKAFLSLFPKELEKIQVDIKEMRNQQMSSQSLVDGHFQFEQRIRRSVALEERLLQKRAMSSNNHSSGAARETGILPEIMSCPEKLNITSEVAQQQHERTAGTEDTYSHGNQVDECKKNVEKKIYANLSEDLMAETDVLAREGQSDGSDEISLTTDQVPSVTSETTHYQVLSSLPRYKSDVADSSGLMDHPESHCFSLNLNLYDNGQNIEPISFVGWPRARVVAPEINTNNGREYVVFNIRVADDTGEWTVARRYRNFEELHRILRNEPEYLRIGLRLPPKRIMLIYPHTTEFVEQRRIALDKYLQVLLSCEKLASNKDVWLFLSDQNCKDFKPDVRIGITKTIADNFDNAKYKLRRSIKDAIEQNQTRADNHNKSALRDLDISEQSSISSSVRYDDDVVFQRAYSRTHNSSCITNDHQEEIPYRKEPAGRYSPHTHLDRHHNGSGNHSSICGKSGTRTERLVSKLEYVERPVVDETYKQDRIRHVHSQNDIKSIASSTDTPYSSQLVEGDLRSTFRGICNWAKEDLNHQQQQHNSSEEDAESCPDREAEFEDYAGISGPLYTVADAVFSLPAQKFFRRQVLQVLRQTLSLLAGDAIDVYLVEKVKNLRTEHTIARMINQLKNSLWPGGVWFGTLPPYNTLKSSLPKASNGRPLGMQKETYIKQFYNPPNAEEMAERLRHRLFRRAPAALVRILGRNCYTRGMKDVYDMLQLPTFVTQIGYGILEIFLLALFPELKETFIKMHREAASMS